MLILLYIYLYIVNIYELYRKFHRIVSNHEYDFCANVTKVIGVYGNINHSCTIDICMTY